MYQAGGEEVGKGGRSCKLSNYTKLENYGVSTEPWLTRPETNQWVLPQFAENS